MEAMENAMDTILKTNNDLVDCMNDSSSPSLGIKPRPTP